MHDPVHVTVGSLDLCANRDVKQEVILMQDHEKRNHLLRLVERTEGYKMLVFCETKRNADDLTRMLRTEGFPALAIHGDKQQRERDWVVDEFRSGRHTLLVATDVASRGLDISDVSYVVNYDFPSSLEDYIHRIGRTGRAGATGIAISYLSPSTYRHIPGLIKILEEANQTIPPELMQLRYVAAQSNQAKQKYRSGPFRSYGVPKGNGPPSHTRW